MTTFPLSGFIAAIIISFACFLTNAEAAECRLLGQQCVEGKETRNIGGQLVTRDCWRFEETYECLKPNSVDYCAALRQTPSCYQTSTSCSSKAFDGSCLKESKTFRCDDPSKPPPANTTVLDDTYTIVDGGPNTTQCDAYSKNDKCQLASHTCIEGPETRMINGAPVYKSCWKWEDEYTCVNPVPKNTCDKLKANPTCTKVGEVCSDTDPKLGCTLKDIQYSCETEPGSTQTVQECSARTTCVGDTCWETGSPADPDFANAVIANEVGRQAAVYQADADGKLFWGVEESCREGWGGLKSCCDDSPGARTNNDVLQEVGFTAVKAVGKYAYNVGSKYMYDYMYSVGEWVGMGSQVATSSAAGAGAANFNVEFYGFGWSSGATPAGSSALGNGFYFDPYSFAIAVAVMVVMELMSCEPEEQQLGMHKGAGLTHYVGSKCSKKFLGACVERKQVYCSFNSKLAKIVNEQGRPQINKSWGTAQSPNCSGFTVAEFSRIDFSRLDFTEFVDDVMRAAEIPNPDQVSDLLSDKMEAKASNDPNEATPKLPFGR